MLVHQGNMNPALQTHFSCWRAHVHPYGSALGHPIQLVSKGTGLQSCLHHAEHPFVGDEDISNGDRCQFASI